MGFLVGFDFEIKYKSGKEKGAVNALLGNLQYLALSMVYCQDWDRLEEDVQREDEN